MSAEEPERAVIAEIGALDEAGLAAVKAWIASGCEGPQPKPDDEKRRVLTDRLMAALGAHFSLQATCESRLRLASNYACLTNLRVAVSRNRLSGSKTFSLYYTIYHGRGP